MKELEQMKILRESMTRIEEGKKEPWITAQGDIDGDDFTGNLTLSDVKKILAGDIAGVHFFGHGQEKLAQIIVDRPDQIREIIRTGGWFGMNNGHVVVEFNGKGEELDSGPDSTDYGTGHNYGATE